MLRLAVKTEPGLHVSPYGSGTWKVPENFTEQNAVNMTLYVADHFDMDDLLLLVVNNTAKKYFSLDCDWNNTYRYQKAYMRKNLYMSNMNPENFCKRPS